MEVPVTRLFALVDGRPNIVHYAVFRQSPTVEILGLPGQPRADSGLSTRDSLLGTDNWALGSPGPCRLELGSQSE